MSYGSDRERTRPQDLKLENINYDSTLEMPSPPISPLKEPFFENLSLFSKCFWKDFLQKYQNLEWKTNQSHIHIQRHLQYQVPILEIASMLMTEQARLRMEHMERAMIQVQWVI